MTQQTIWQVLLTRESSLEGLHRHRVAVMVENTRVLSKIVASQRVLNEKPGDPLQLFASGTQKKKSIHIDRRFTALETIS